MKDLIDELGRRMAEVERHARFTKMPVDMTDSSLTGEEPQVAPWDLGESEGAIERSGR